MILPFGVTRGGETVPAAPVPIAALQDSFRNGVATVLKIMNGDIREPKDMTPQELLDLGALASAASLTSFRLRGAGQPAANVSDVTAAGQRLAIDVPRAAVSEGLATSAAARATGAVPFGGAPLRSASKSALEELEERAVATKGALGSSSIFQAGQKIEEGITGFAGRDSSSILSQRVGDAYKKVDALIDPSATANLSETLALVNQLGSRAQAAGTSTGRAAQEVLDAATRPGGLTYQAAKDLRTKIGDWMSDAPLAASAGVSQGEAKAVYAALTKDLRNVVEAAGGKPALEAWEAANATAAQAAEIRTALEKVLKTGTEGEGALFARLIGMAGTAARADVDTLGLAREAVGDQNWGEVLSAMVQRWGFNDRGDFDPALFAKQWGRVTPEAKGVLFKTAAEQRHLQALDDIAKVSTVADNLRTASKPPPALMTSALGVTGASAAIGALTPQHFGAIATAILGARAVSNVLAKPEGAAAFAQWARAYEGFAGKPNQTTAGALGNAARALAYFVAIDQGLGKKEQLFLGNYLQGAPIGQPFAKPTAASSTNELKA
jgi:hypothetical protein